MSYPGTMKADSLAKLQDMHKMATAIFYGTDVLRRRDGTLTPWHLRYMERTHSNAGDLLRRIQRSIDMLESDKDPA